MPSGPPELHKKWCNAGPHEGQGDFNAMHFLRERGYTLTDTWFWKLPPGKTDMPEGEEGEAMYYLQAEWDFGGVAF